MKKDIEIPIVKDVAVAIVQEINELNVLEWNTYLINLQKEKIEGVLVTSKGYGENKNTGEKIETSVLRHFLEDVEAESFKKIEPITDELLSVSNEYWVSFWLDKKLFDKKYIFLAESINEDYLTTIPLLNKKGILIK